MVGLIRGFAFLIFVSTFFSQATFALQNCTDLFYVGSSTQKSVQDYISQVQSEQKPEILPQFLNRQQDAANSEHWDGVTAPKLIQTSLPDGVSAISHQLFQAQPGVVKNDATGMFTSVRADLQFQGTKIGTNVGVNAAALAANLSTDKKYLARKDARAVILFLHGGGTKGTGHHVANNITNYMNNQNVDVVSIDNPWHAEGPRYNFKSADEYIEYLIEFTQKFIPPGVPVFIAGHSLGGTYADMVLRRSDKNPRIKQTFAGAIPLSSVPDLEPGKSFREKSAQENLRMDGFQLGTELYSRLSDDDKILPELIVADGKVSPIAWFEIQNMLVDNDWTMPADQGANYIPSLHVYGKGDWLYVGLEDHFQKYVADLKNAQVVLYDKGIDFRNTHYIIGHQIFDNIMTGTKDPETFIKIRDFIFKIAHQDNPVVRVQSKTDNFQKIIAAYLNNLVFRKFVDEFVIERKIQKKDATKALDARFVALQKYQGEAVAIQKKNKGLAPDELNKLLPTINDVNGKPMTQQEAKAELEFLSSIKGDNFVPDGPKKELAEKIITRRDQIQAEIRDLTKQKAQTKQNLEEASIQRRKLERTIFSYFNAYVGKSRGHDQSQNERDLLAQMTHSPAFESSLETTNANLKKLKGILDQISSQSNEYLAHLVENGGRTVEQLQNLPPSLQQLFQTYISVEKEYLDSVKKLKSSFVSEASKNNLGPSIYELYRKLNPENSAESLDSKIEKLGTLQKQLDDKIMALYEERIVLNEQYLNEITSDYFEFKKTRTIDVLNMNLQGAEENIGILQKMMSEWVALWGERPPAEGTSLY